MQKQKRVVVGLSGGVDSSVAAYLLKKEGYEVIGMFMKNWHDESVTISNECPWMEDSTDAMLVAQKLGIPFQAIDLSEDYRKRIVDYMFAEYQAGRTPNPDILCNREIKFDIFLKAAMKLKADYVATGHYCQKSEIQKNGKTIYRLMAGADPNKDQSYFLCQLDQEQLSKALFPIGHLQKSEVRKIAKEQNLVTADKKDSQGLCFVGKVRLPEFLQQQLQPKKGDIMLIPENLPLFAKKRIPAGMDLEDLDAGLLDDICLPATYGKQDGKKMGEHQGAHYFTIGQRKGLQVGGTGKPLFVIATGARPAVPPIPGLDEAGYLTHESAFDQDELPSSMVILGAGPIGLEFAQLYSRLGASVTVVEMLPEILPGEDPDISATLREMLEHPFEHHFAPCPLGPRVPLERVGEA
jgi:tRNA-uridine 2-sulfurtransferase